MNAFLNENGTPNLTALIATANRCTPSIPGGTLWLDQIRFCKWPRQFIDGRKHDISQDANGAAVPWDGASDVRPMVVDGIINERAAMKTTAFWRSMLRGSGGYTESSAYAVALAEHLVGSVLYKELTREVELSAQYIEHYGWTILAPRWRSEIGMKRQDVTMEQIQVEATQAQQQLQQAQQPPAQGQPAAPATPPDPKLVGLANLPSMILDPTQEADAINFFVGWYDEYVSQSLPERLRDRAPKVKRSTAARVVRELRTTGKSGAPLPYLCVDRPEITALKPWDEVYLPPELTDAKQFVLQAERVSETELKNRIITEEYNAEWVEAAAKFKGQVSPTLNMPVGMSGNALNFMGGASQTQPVAYTGNSDNGLIEILHAVYRAYDDDGIPGIYMTTYHRSVGKGKNGEDLYAKHGLAEVADGEMPYVPGVRENWCRSITASRSVPEIASTQQNILKGITDAIIDRQSITTLPPVNVYESPTGTKYQFAPAKQNYVRAGREPEFMQMPSGQGMNESLEALAMVKKAVDNHFCLLAEDVPPPRVAMGQDMAVKGFLIMWSAAIQQALGLCQKYMSDADFAEITGAEPGWLDAHRNETCLMDCEFHFDVRELDPDLTMKQIEAVNKIVLPADVMGTVNRSKWTAVMMRAINSEWSREVITPVADASQQLFDRVKGEVLNMFAGVPPKFLDKQDPTAASMLQFTKQIVMSSPSYLHALSDEAIVAIAGQNAPMLAQQIGRRNADNRFSTLLVKWLENLQFIGVTQPNNAQVGRIGVDANEQQPQAQAA